MIMYPPTESSQFEYWEFKVIQPRNCRNNANCKHAQRETSNLSLARGKPISPDRRHSLRLSDNKRHSHKRAEIRGNAQNRTNAYTHTHIRRHPPHRLFD